METIIKLLLINILPIVCIISSAVLAYFEKEGWGWMVFVALLSGNTVSTENKGDKK